MRVCLRCASTGKRISGVKQKMGQGKAPSQSHPDSRSWKILVELAPDDIKVGR